MIEAKLGCDSFSHFSVLGLGVLLPGLETFNDGKHLGVFYCFVFLFVFVFISNCFCTILCAVVYSK